VLFVVGDVLGPVLGSRIVQSACWLGESYRSSDRFHVWLPVWSVGRCLPSEVKRDIVSLRVGTLKDRCALCRLRLLPAGGVDELDTQIYEELSRLSDDGGPETQ
jgi:hypothetical protein